MVIGIQINLTIYLFYSSNQIQNKLYGIILKKSIRKTLNTPEI